MKRTHSSEPSSNPSHSNLMNGAPTQSGQEHQPQGNGAAPAAPTLYTPPGQDTTTEDPLTAFYENAELTDWDAYAQMLPHTPPIAANRNTENMQDSEVSEDERSENDASVDGLSASDSDNNSDERTQTHFFIETKTAKITSFKSADLSKQLEICKHNASLTELEIPGSDESDSTDEEFTENPQQTLKTLSEFFKGPQNIQRIIVNSLTDTGLKLDTQFLKVLFDAPNVRHLSSYAELDIFSTEDCQSVRDLIRNNTTLKSLTLSPAGSTHATQAIIEALSENSSIESLCIIGGLAEGLGEMLATMLKSNLALKHLQIDLVGERDAQGNTMKEVHIAAQGLLHNRTLESFDLEDPMRANPWRMQTQLMETLLQNHGLKSLSFPTGLSFTQGSTELLSKLIETHPTLSSIELGGMSKKPKHQVALLSALKPNPRIQHLGASWRSFAADELINNHDQASFSINFLQTLKNFPGLTSVSLECFPVTHQLLDFLEKHPKIEHIRMLASQVTDRHLQQRLLDMVRYSSQIKKFELYDGRDLTRAERKFIETLNKALALNQEVSSDAKIAAASSAMFGLLADKANRGGAEPLPWVPPEITNELAKAIARHVRPDKAKAIFDELILHAPVRQ
jgi:hypothetical protein